MFGHCFVMQCLMSFLYSLQYSSAEKERAGCFALISFLVSCTCYSSESIPRCAMDWSAVYDCGTCMP